jgi:hypothetical protein
MRSILFGRQEVLCAKFELDVLHAVPNVFCGRGLQFDFHFNAGGVR